MQTIRIVLWACVALVGAGTAWLFLDSSLPGDGNDFGARFELSRADGGVITDDDLIGRPHLMFFGFTNCPEVCPTTLFEASGWLKQLGDDADKLDVYFVTVDPERDTAEVMRDYLGAFDPRIVGITGPVEEIEKVTKGYHVYYKKVPLEDGDYTVDHTASVYLMKPDGSFMGTIAYAENPDTAIEKLKRLLESGA